MIPPKPAKKQWRLSMESSSPKITEQYDLRRYTLARIMGAVQSVTQRGRAEILRIILDGGAVVPEELSPEAQATLGLAALDHRTSVERINTVLGLEDWVPNYRRTGGIDERAR